MVQTGYMLYPGRDSSESPGGFFVEDHYGSPPVTCVPETGAEARFFFRVELDSRWDQTTDPAKIGRQLTLDQARYLANQILYSVSQAEDSLRAYSNGNASAPSA